MKFLKRSLGTAARMSRHNRELLCLYLRMHVRRWLRLQSRTGLSRVGGVQFDFDVGVSGEVFDMAQGYYEIDTLSIMKRFLKPGGVFLDVGSNIGYFSAVGLSLVGPRGQVHAFEPVPAYVERLRKMQSMNPDYDLVVNAFAAGAEPGKTEIEVASDNFGGHTMVNGLLSPSDQRTAVAIDVQRLDEYVMRRDLKNIQLVKIDTEGFEYFVLQGFSRCFAPGSARPPIVCEITTRAYDLLGTSLVDFANSLNEWGYSAHRIGDYRPLNVTRPGFRCGNVLLLPC